MPETKGISLERMDKIFGEVDAVEVGEHATGAEKIEVEVYSHVDRKDDPKAETVEAPYDEGHKSKEV